MLASFLSLLLAFLSSGLAAGAVEGCAAEAGGVCETPEMEVPFDEPDSDDADAAKVMLLQSQLQLQRQRRVQALTQAHSESHAPKSQLSIVVSADAEAVAAVQSSELAVTESEADASRASANATPAAAAVAATEAARAEPAAAAPAAPAREEANASQAAAGAAAVTAPQAAKEPAVLLAAAEPAAAPAVPLPALVDANASQTSAEASLAEAAAAVAAAAPAAEQAAAPAAAVEPKAEMKEEGAAVAAAVSALALKKGTAAQEADRAWWPFGDIIGGITDMIPGAAEKVLDGAATAAAQAAAASFASVVNSSLILIDDKANALVSWCAAYKDHLLSNVSQSGERKIAHYEDLVLSNINAVTERWSFIVDTMGAAGPHLVRAVAGLGLNSLAAECQTGLDRILELAGYVTNVLHNVSTITSNMAGKSEKELRGALGKINATINSGLDAASAFADESALLVQRVISGVAGKLGVSLLGEVEEPMDKAAAPDGVKATFQALLQQAGDTMSKVSTGMSDYLSGTLEAAQIVLSPVESGAAINARWLSGILLAVVCLGANVN